jgi:hypothetical protein
VAQKSISSAAKRSGSASWGHVAGVGEDLEAAAGHRVVGSRAVLDRDDRVLLAPDDQRRQQAGQIEPVAAAGEPWAGPPPPCR